MLKLKLLTIILSLFFFSVTGFTQNLYVNYAEKDTSEDWDDWDDDSDDDRECEEKWDWDFNFDWEDFKEEGSPTISGLYGLSRTNIKDFNSEFTKPGLLELRLGHFSEEEKDFNSIVKSRFNFVFLSNFSNDLKSNSTASGIETELWRFGGGGNTGYGYEIGTSSVTLFNGSTFGWSRLNVEEFPQYADETKKLERFNQSFRFGTNAEGGIRIKLFPLIALEAGYERSVIFERHLFWKWLGSLAIEMAGQGALDLFINEIMDSSPVAVPIVNFVLKNALSYGMYELRQDKMNWPFPSAQPLSYDQFKFGVTFVF